MTPEQRRETAEQMMLDAAHNAAGHGGRNIREFFDDITAQRLPREDLQAVHDLIESAEVEITWPDPCPACGVVGCTEHPTWAAESGPAGDDMPVFTIKAKDRLAGPAIEAYRDLCSKYGLHEQAAQVHLAFDEIVGWQVRNADRVHMPDHTHVPELPEWERDLLARQAAEERSTEPANRGRLIYDWHKRDEEPFDLTAAQEIRLRLTEALLGDVYRPVDPQLVTEVTAAVLPLAQMVETGEHDDLEDACTESCPGREMHEPGEVQRWKSAYLTSQEAAALAKMRLVQIEDLWKDRIYASYGVVTDAPVVLADDLRACLDWVPEAEPTRLPTGLPWGPPDGGAGVKVIWEPKPAGYSETLRIPGTDTSVVAVPGSGFERVVTAQDPGGLLSDQEFDKAVSDWQRAKGEGYTPSAGAQEPPEPSDPHSDTQEGSTGLHGPGATAQSLSERSDEGAGAS